MKRIILLLSLSTIFSVYALAQQRGDFAVGGGINFGTSTLYTTTTVLGEESPTAQSNGGINFGFNPEVSYFVIDNLSLSAGLSYALNASEESPDVLYTNIALFTIGANYYVHILSDKLFYTPGFTIGLGGGSLIQNTQAQKITTAIPFSLAANFDLGRIELAHRQLGCLCQPAKPRSQLCENGCIQFKRHLHRKHQCRVRDQLWNIDGCEILFLNRRQNRDIESGSSINATGKYQHIRRSP